MKLFTDDCWFGHFWWRNWFVLIFFFCSFEESVISFFCFHTFSLVSNWMICKLGINEAAFAFEKANDWRLIFRKLIFSELFCDDTFYLSINRLDHGTAHRVMGNSDIPQRWWNFCMSWFQLHRTNRTTVSSPEWSNRILYTTIYAI